MLVAETDIRNQTVSVTVLNNLGVVTSIDIDHASTIEQLKCIAVAKFYGQYGKRDELEKKNHFYNLVHIKSNRVLTETNSVGECGICKGDEVLLVSKRTNETQKTKKYKAGPSKDEIYEATDNLATLNPEHSGDPKISIDLKNKKSLLVILIDLADKLLCMNEDIMKVYKEAEECLQQSSTIKEEATFDQGAVDQLTDMGFSPERAKEALRTNENNLSNATEWLVENPNQDKPELAKEPQNKPVLKSEEPQKTTSSSQPSVTAKEETSNKDVTTYAISRLKGVEKVKRIIRSFRAAKSKGFTPDKEALHRLKDMGFDEEDAREALRVQDNKEKPACEYLLSDNTMKLSQLDITEQEWTEDTELYDKLRESPQIQSALNQPKGLIALLYILENTAKVDQWAADSDVAAMLDSMVKIYKKHLCLQQKQKVEPPENNTRL